jgi:hypothetical protein
MRKLINSMLAILIFATCTLTLEVSSTQSVYGQTDEEDSLGGAEARKRWGTYCFDKGKSGCKEGGAACPYTAKC